MANPEPGPRRSARMLVHHPLDLAVLLVSVPMWTRENELKEYPDRLPSEVANHLLTLRYILAAPSTWLRAQMARPIA